MAAKRLARTSGMDYAILSGGDVAPLGGNAVTQVGQGGAGRWAGKERWATEQRIPSSVIGASNRSEHLHRPPLLLLAAARDV